MLGLVLMLTLLPPLGSANAHNEPDLWHHCQSGEVCLFRAAWAEGGVADWTGDDPTYVWNSYDYCTSGWSCAVNDTASSIDNDGTSCGARHYYDVQYTGSSFWLAKGDLITDLAGSGFNDELSSHDWCDDRRS